MRNPLRISVLLLIACSGRFEVVTLASNQLPGRLAVDTSSVYWLDYSDGITSIRRVPISGGTPTTSFSGHVNDIAADRANLYWVGPDAVMKLPSGGGSPVLLAAARFGSRIAVEGSDVFWIDPDGLHKVDTSGAATTLFAGPVHPSALAASGGSAFFVKQAACPPCGFDIAKVSAQGGAPLTLFTETRNGSLDALGVGASSVYWGLEDTGTLSTVPVAGGAETTLFVRGPPGQVQYRIGGVAADATGVYFVVSGYDGSGSVIRIAPHGDVQGPFGLTTLADNQWAPYSVVLDDANVYWGAATPNQFGGSIFKLHK
jgi:hypothetical protein